MSLETMTFLDHRHSSRVRFDTLLRLEMGDEEAGRGCLPVVSGSVIVVFVGRRNADTGRTDAEKGEPF